MKLRYCIFFSQYIIMWLALHTYVSSLPRDSSGTYQLTRQTSHFEVLLASNCHHHFDASGTSKRNVWGVRRKVSDESLGRDGTYVCRASHMIMYCEMFTLFSSCIFFTNNFELTGNFKALFSVKIIKAWLYFFRLQHFPSIIILFSSGQVWDLRKNDVLYKMSGHTDTVAGLRLSPDGSFILSNAMDNTGLSEMRQECFPQWLGFTCKSTVVWCQSPQSGFIIQVYCKGNVKMPVM